MTNTKFALLLTPVVIAVLLLAVIAGALTTPKPVAPVVVGSQSFIQPAAYASRTLAVTTTAAGLSAFGFAAADIATGVPQKAYITANGGAVYVMFDGSTPSVATNTHIITTDGRLDLVGAGNISNTKLISAGSVTVTITLEK